MSTIGGFCALQEAIDALIGCPVVFGCVDGDGARLVLTELAAAYELTLIDAAAEIFPGPDQPLRWGGRVVVARPGDFCVDCAHQIDMEVTKQELETEEARDLRRRHGYGAGDAAPAPAVINLNGVVANLALTEFMVMVTGLRDPRRCLVYHADRGIVNDRRDTRRPSCYTCGYLVGSAKQRTSNGMCSQRTVEADLKTLNGASRGSLQLAVCRRMPGTS